MRSAPRSHADRVFAVAEDRDDRVAASDRLDGPVAPGRAARRLGVSRATPHRMLKASGRTEDG